VAHLTITAQWSTAGCVYGRDRRVAARWGPQSQGSFRHQTPFRKRNPAPRSAACGPSSYFPFNGMATTHVATQISARSRHLKGRRAWTFESMVLIWCATGPEHLIHGGEIPSSRGGRKTNLHELLRNMFSTRACPRSLRLTNTSSGFRISIFAPARAFPRLSSAGTAVV